VTAGCEHQSAYVHWTDAMVHDPVSRLDDQTAW
jgi:hypothetical protein